MVHKEPSLNCKNNFKAFRIAWLFPNMDIVKDPAYRIRRYNIYKELNKYNYLAVKNEMFVYGCKINTIDFNYFKAAYGEGDIDKFNNYLKDHFDIIVFFNVSEYDYKLIEKLTGLGKKCLFDHSENVFKLPYEDEIMNACTAISCCSTSLASITDSYLKKIGIVKDIYIIKDSIESSKDIIKAPTSTNRAVLMGGVGNIVNIANPLLEICKESGYDFVTISDIDYNKEYETKKWTPYTWIDDMISCDVALCYNDPINFPAKSNIKVTTAMALGLPVIANTIESYKEAIMHEYNGYIAKNKDDWVKYLNLLKSNELRATIGLRAHNSAFEKYSIKKICLDFISMISNIL